jgi:hypothetical protein
MDDLQSLLSKRQPNEPEQFRLLREYVMNNHQSKSSVRLNTQGYSLTVPNGAIAMHLRMELPQIVEHCLLDKKLFIRIGHVD